ncbi:LamG domain-containing protein [Synechococcus sp. R55.1]
MNDSNGSTVLQEVIGNNHAGPMKSPVGATQAPQPIAGQFGGAIDFVKFPGSGLTGAVVTNTSGALPFIGQGDFSIVTWIKFPPTSAPAPPTGPGGRHYILNKYDAPQNRGYALYVVRPAGSGSSYLEFLWGDNSNTPQTLRSNTAITPNQWHLVAVTFARNVGSNSLAVTLYVDGAPKGTYTSTAPWGSLVNNLSIMIGYQPSSVDEPIALDELQIYNRALTANEISQIYNAGSGTQPPCVQQPSGMVAWWPLDETSGTTAADIAGFPNNGTHVNGPTPVSGKVAGALRFDGVNDHVRVPDHAELNVGTGNFTLDAWVRTGSSGLIVLVDKRSGPTPQGYSLFLVNGRLGFQMANGVGSSDCAATPTPGRACVNYVAPPTSPNVADGQWHHVAAVVNRANATSGVRLYVDGVQVFAGSPLTGNLDNTSDLYLGMRTPAQNGGGFLPGDLDEVELIKRALTQQEIQAIFNAGSAGKCKCVQPPLGMVAWYRMDGNANDSGGSNNPSATNAISFVAGKDGQGVTFSPGSYIEIPHSSALANQQFTIDAWVKPQGPGPNNDFWGSVIVQKGLSAPTGYTDVPISLWWSAQQQKFGFTFGNMNTDQIVSSSTFPAGQWYHVAATYDGSTMKLYVNGNLEASKPFTSSITYDPSIPWTIGSTAAPIRAAGYPRTFNGVIDEVEIFNRALSQAEIQAIYKPGKCKFKKVFDPSFNPN